MKKNYKMHVFAFVTILIWGSAFPFTRIIGDQFSSYTLACVRCVVPAVFLLLLGKSFALKKPFCKTDLLWFAITGMGAYSACSLFFNLGLETLTSSTASMVTSIAPVLTAIGVWKIYGEKIRPVGWLCICAAFAGVCILLLWQGSLSGGIGILWEALYAVVFAVYNVICRKLGEKGYSPMDIVTWSAVFGAVEMLAFVPATVSDFCEATVPAALAVLYIGLFPAGLAYIFWNRALDMAENTSTVSNWLFVIPLVASVLGFVLLREVPDMGTIIGGIVIIASVVVFSLKGVPGSKQLDAEKNE